MKMPKLSSNYSKTKMGSIINMSKSIFIHIGTHKTGTSAVQKALLQYNTDLQKEGVKYINLYSFEKAQQLMHLETYDKALEFQLKEFLSSYVEPNISKYLICCEYLSGNPKKLYANSNIIANLLYNAVIDFDVKKVF